MKQMEEKSGVTVHQAQVALARRWIGDVSNGMWHEDNIKIATGVSGMYERGAGDDMGGGGSVGLPVNQNNTFRLPFTAAKEAPEKIASAIKPVPVPDEKESEKVVDQFERGKDGLLPPHPIADSVAHHALGNSKGLVDEKWLGTAEEEKAS